MEKIERYRAILQAMVKAKDALSVRCRSHFWRVGGLVVSHTELRG